MTLTLARICLPISTALNVFAALADPGPLRALPAVGFAAATGFVFGRKAAPDEH